jgi:hypothetical protein
MTSPRRSIRQTVPSCRDCTHSEPKAAIIAPGLGTWMVRFAAGSGDEGGSVDGAADEGCTELAETVPAGEDVADEAALHPASDKTRHTSAARRTIRPR